MFNDEYSGVGGTYMLDPKTGVRTRVEDAPVPDTVASDVPPAGDASSVELEKVQVEKPVKQGR